MQYWDSLDKLYAYAADPRATHRPAWTAFNQRSRRAPDAVGIWHETYAVSRAESRYVGMPPLGLAAVTGSRPVGPRAEEGSTPSR